MSVIEQFRNKVSNIEGFAQAWIVDKRVAIITHLGVFILGAILGYKIGH